MKLFTLALLFAAVTVGMVPAADGPKAKVVATTLAMAAVPPAETAPPPRPAKAKEVAVALAVAGCECQAKLDALAKRVAAVELALAAPSPPSVPPACADGDDTYAHLLAAVRRNERPVLSVGGASVPGMTHAIPVGCRGIRAGVYDCFLDAEGEPAFVRRPDPQPVPAIAPAVCPGGVCPRPAVLRVR